MVQRGVAIVAMVDRCDDIKHVSAPANHTVGAESGLIACNREGVYTLNDPYKAEVIQSDLHSQGIACELDGEHQAGFSDILEIGILVRASDADRARRVIRRREPRKPRHEAADRLSC